jgi:hypothetical protein
MEFRQTRFRPASMVRVSTWHPGSKSEPRQRESVARRQVRMRNDFSFLSICVNVMKAEANGQDFVRPVRGGLLGQDVVYCTGGVGGFPAASE